MNAQHITLPIENLACGDSRIVERILAGVPGVTHVYLNPATEMAYVEYDPALAGPTELFAALEREGYGRPAHRPLQQLPAQPAPKHTLDLWRMTLAGGIWLAGVYMLCIVADVLFPEYVQMYRLWERLLIGFDWAERRTLALGLVETFVYGAAAAWSFAGLYNRLSARALDPAATLGSATQDQAIGQEGGIRA